MVYCLLWRIGTISDPIWCTWKKVLCDCKSEHSKIVTNGHQHTKTTEDEKVYTLNKCLYSNWKTIYPRLKYFHNGPHKKVPLNFWFFIMTFNLCFHYQLWIKLVCLHIIISSGHVEQTHSQFPKYLWMFDTEWDAHQISILDKLRN